MANFNFYLNRQGVRGNKGEKGDTGFAPIIEVDTNTAAEYKLKIITEAGELITDNLRGSAVTDDGGTYMRYNPETQAMYAAPADRASENEAGIIYLADDSAMQQFDIYSAVTPKKLVDNLPFYFKSSDDSISITQDPDTLKIDLKANVVEDISRLEARVSADEILLGSHQISIDNLDRDKVDKVAGKGLSTNDFTNADKSKLEGIEAGAEVNTVNSVNGQTGDVVIEIPDSATWGNITGTLSDQTDLQNALNDKQNVIFDLNTIRSGASAGATALQPNDNITELVNNAGYITGIDSSDVTTALGYTPYDSSNPNGYTSNVGTVTSVNNISPISGNVTINIPTDTSDLTNGAGFLTSVPAATTSSLGLVQPDGTTITINNGVISSSGGSTPSNMVTTDTSQQISGAKTFTANNTNIKKLSLTNGGTTSSYADQIKFATVITSPQHTSGYPTVGCKVETINGVASSVLHLRGDNTDAISTAQPFQANYVKIYDAINQNNKPYLTVNNITSTGGTVTITDNGINGINIEASGGSTPTNMVTIDTEQTISGHKIFSDSSTEIAGDLYITQDGTSYIRMGDNTAYATPILTMDDTNDILTVGDTSKFLKLKAYNTVVISNQRGNEFTIGYDTLTYKKSDDTVVDLLALEARIAALEARINGGNA